MKTKLLYRALVVGLGAALALPAFGAGDPVAGKLKAFSCLGCHGVPDYTTQYPTYRVPKLGGQHAAYIIAALKEYKAKQRGFATMQAQAASLSEQDMEDLAAYFSQYPGSAPDAAK